MASIKQKTANSGHTLGTESVPWAEVHSKQLKVQGDATITGDLTVVGNSTTVDVQNLVVEDNLIKIAKINEGTSTDVGIYAAIDTTSSGTFSNGITTFTGLVKDQSHTDQAWRLFKTKAETDNLDLSNVTTTVNFNHASVEHDVLEANLQVPESGYLKVPNSDGTLTDYITAVTLGTAKANKVLTADANKDLDGLRHLTMTGTLTAGNVTIAGSSIAVDGGAPIFDSIDVDGGSIDNTVIGANISAAITASSLVVDGNVDLGSSGTDTLTINAKVDSNVIPTGNITLGTLSARWAEAHVTTVNAVTLSATGNSTLGTTDSDTLTIEASVNSDIVPDADGTRSLGSSSNRWAHVHADYVTANSLTAGRVVFAGANGKLIDDSDLTFSGATLTATKISAGAFSSSNVDITGGSIDGVSIEGSNITVDTGATLNVSGGALTTSSTQNLYILENANSDVDFGTFDVTAATFVGKISTLSNHNTDNLSEGSTNLYYTDERVDDRVSNLIVDGQAIGTAYDDVNNSLTIAVDTATASTLGVASFTLSDFAVSSGEVSIKTAGVSNAQLAGSIANDKLSNSWMDIAGKTVVLGGEITAASIAKAVENQTMAISKLTDLDGRSGSLTIFDTLNSSGTLTIGHIDGVIATPADLDITGTMLQSVDLATGREYRIKNSSGAAVSVLTATTLGSGVFNSSLTSVGALASGSIATGFGTISTENDISTTKVIDLASDADADDYSADSATGRLTFGTEDDLSLYHGGSHSYIVNKVGELRLDVPTLSEISLSVAGTEEAHVDADGLDLASGNDYRIANNSVLTATTLGSGVLKSSLTSVGALDSGSITSNFGSINIGGSQIQTSGTISAGNLSVDNLRLDGATIGHSSDLDLMTLSSGTLTVAGKVALTTLSINGEDVTATADEINILDGNTTATTTTIVGTDRIVLNDSGTMVQVAVTDLAAYLGDEITAMPNLVTLGTISTGAWEGDVVAVTYGGTGRNSINQNAILIGDSNGNFVESTLLNVTAGTAEASKALVLNSDSSITSGLSTLTASTFTTVDGGVSLNGTNLTASNIIASAVYPSSGNLTLSAVGSANVTVSVDLNCEGKIIGGDSGVEFQGSMTLDTDDHVIIATTNKTLPIPTAGREMIYINNSDSQITLTVSNTTLHDIYFNGSAVDSVNIGARNTLRLIAASSSLWYVV